MKTEGAERDELYQGDRLVEVDMVAKQEVAARPCDPAIPRRSRGWQPVSSGEHGGDDLGCTKMTCFIKKVRMATRMRKKVKRECGVDGVRRK